MKPAPSRSADISADVVVIIVLTQTRALSELFFISRRTMLPPVVLQPVAGATIVRASAPGRRRSARRRLVEVEAIQASVSMQPHDHQVEADKSDERWFVWEQCGLEIGIFWGVHREGGRRRRSGGRAGCRGGWGKLV